MKIRVISLVSRQDRRDKFLESNKGFLDKLEWSWLDAVNGSELDYDTLCRMGFDTDKNWRDPLLKRTLTWGEVGCFLSHYQLWEECVETDEVMLVLEDDVTLHKDVTDIEKYLGDHELLYLVHNEMEGEGVESISENLVKPCYPYWLAAYIVTPAGAKKLINSDIKQNIIPADEYVPRMLDRIDAVAFKEPVAKQISRDTLGSDIEPNLESDYVIDFNTHVLTCYSDEVRAEKLKYSSEYVGIKPINVIQGEWQGTTMEGPGGGQKIHDLVSYITRHELPDNDVILFTDAYDVFYDRDLNTILGRYLGFKRNIVFSAEKHLWPDESLRFPPSHTPYRYLNSGTFIGRVGEIKRMMRNPIEKSDDDQLYLQREFLTGKYDVVLDVEQYIFCTHEKSVVIQEESIYNPVVGCYSCVYHGNGGEIAKEKFETLYYSLYPEKKFANLTVKDYKVIGNEMLLIDFLSPSQCEEWIRIGDEHGGWAPHEADQYPSHDIHFKELGLWEETNAWWNKVAAKVFQEYWKPHQNYHLRKSFLMKYSENTQKTLGFHNDVSAISGSVKLNDDYEGATLIFPRQQITNKDIPIGKMLLFPGQITHGHYVDQLQSGTKYSATFWSARYDGDYLDP